MNVINPPQRVLTHQRKIIFLAGSIEMGTAKEWQQQAIELFDSLTPEEEKNDYLILNPRRPDWDSSWRQEFSDPQFYQQVKWELSSLQKADYVLFYFDPSTKSPVSMLELGAFHHKAIVICPDGFWRKGNIDVFCDEFDIMQLPDLASAVKQIILSPSLK